jgi:hypothetical protein
MDTRGGNRFVSMGKPTFEPGFSYLFPGLDSVDKKLLAYYKNTDSGLDRLAGRFHCKKAWR